MVLLWASLAFLKLLFPPPHASSIPYLSNQTRLSQYDSDISRADMNPSDGSRLKIGEACFHWEDESPTRKRNRLAQREYRKSVSSWYLPTVFCPPLTCIPK
jgi:hypothetical protein